METLSGTLAGGFTYLAARHTQLTFMVYKHTAGRLGPRRSATRAEPLPGRACGRAITSSPLRTILACY